MILPENKLPQQQNRHLIIQLLVQDMKHEQLVQGLQSLGFNSDIHGSDICAVVAALMGISPENLSWDWLDIYMNFLKQSTAYEVTDTGSSLQELANTCYTFLTTQAEKERNT